MSDPLACPKCGYSRMPSDTVPLTQCAKCGIVFAKYAATKPRENVSSELNTNLDDQPERLEIPGVIVFGAVVALCLFGLWSVVTGLASWDDSYGYGRSESIVLLLFGMAAFVAAGLVLLLWLSRGRRWARWLQM